MVDTPLVVFHLDLKVAHYKREYLQTLFARLRRMGYTHLCVEIEDKVRLEVCPEAAWVEAYSKEEFAAILEDARQAGLEPFPLVQTLGHLEYVLRHARFVPLREDPCGHAQLCPSNPKAVRFAADMCAEVLELFGNPALFHVGGDEASSLGVCPECARRVRVDGVSRLYVEYLRAICAPLIEIGSRPIIWADMVLAHPEALEDMPREIILCDWDYFNGDDVPHFLPFWADAPDRRAVPSDPDTISAAFTKRYGEFLYPNGTGKPPALWFFADYLRAQGHDVIVAPATRCWGDNMFFAAAPHLPNCAGASATALLDQRAMGVMVTSWAVRLNHIETQWAGIAMPSIVTATGKRHQAELMGAAADTLGLGNSQMLQRVHETLGKAHPFTRSHGEIFNESLGARHDGAIGAEIYGMRRDFTDEVKRFFAEKEFAKSAIAKVEEQLAEYDAIEADLELMCGNESTGIVDTRHWLLALRSLRHKARQFMALAELDSTGTLTGARLASVEHELAEVWDETAACLEQSYTPASLHRELMMRFGAEQRFLVAKMAATT